jgi:hypothetical protein
MFIDGEMSEKVGDVPLAHFVWVPLVVKQNEAANPIDVGLFGANGIMFYAQVPAHPIQQFR